MSVLAGCATVNPEPDYQRARQHVAAATGSGGVYEPGDEEVITQKVNDLLADGLAADEAVEIALLNNPGLQRLFQDIGVARTEVVQSGLLSNPSLGLSFRFPAGGGRSNIEASIAQELVDLWQIPARKRAAQRELDTTVLEVAHSAAQLAADARSAYYDVAAADRNLEIAVENVAIVQKLLDAALARKQAGVVGELDVNLARGVVMSAELDVRSARLDTRVQRRRLASLLGLTRHAEDLVLRDGLVTPACADLDGDRIVRLSLDNRLDVRAAANAVAAAAEKVELEYRKVFPSVELGLGLERSDRRALPGRKLLADTARASIANGTLTAPDIESRAQRQAERRAEIDVILGPSLDLTLPIFDQNQAQIARAKFEYEQAVKGLDSLERQLIQDTRDAVERATTASETARDYETKPPDTPLSPPRRECSCRLALARTNPRSAAHAPPDDWRRLRTRGNSGHHDGHSTTADMQHIRQFRPLARVKTRTEQADTAIRSECLEAGELLFDHTAFEWAAQALGRRQHRPIGFKKAGDRVPIGQKNGLRSCRCRAIYSDSDGQHPVFRVGVSI